MYITKIGKIWRFIILVEIIIFYHNTEAVLILIMKYN